MIVGFVAYGLPGPQGSKRFGSQRDDAGSWSSSAKVKPWRQDVRFSALQAAEAAAWLAPIEGLCACR